MPLSQVYPIPPCSCIALPVDVDGDRAGVGLRHRRRCARIRAIVRDGIHSGADELTRNGNLYKHVGAGMLDSLKRPDGPAELVPHTGIGHRGSEHRFGHPEAVAGHGHRRPVAQPPDARLRIALEAQNLTHRDPICRNSGEATCFIQHRLRCHGQSRGLDEGDTIGIRCNYEQPVGAFGIRHERRATG